MQQFFPILFSLLFFWNIVPTVADVTFGSCPNRCTCEPDDDGVLIIDCTGADYDYVPVTSIPCGTKKLLFKNNNLKKITRMSFLGLREVEEIDISGNFISHIEAESFSGMPFLQRINLGQNQMSTIEAYYFRAASFQNALVSLDGNPFYCDEDLKENINQVKNKITFGGLVCAGGEIWRVLGKVKGRTYEDVESQIRKNYESWEIALITIACFLVVLMIMGIILVIYRIKTSHYETGEVDKTTGEKRAHVRGSIQGSDSDADEDHHHRRPHHSSRGTRKIEITSEDPYYHEEDDAIFRGTTNPGPPNSESGSERPFSPDSRA